jgi:hypothetical protein
MITGAFIWPAAVEDLLPEHRAVMDPDFLELVDRGLSLSAVAFRRLDDVRTKQWHAFTDGHCRS